MIKMKDNKPEDLIETLQNVLNTEIKILYSQARSGFIIDWTDENKFHKNNTVYSQVNQEIYFLIKFKSNTLNNPSFSYSLLIFSLETNSLKSTKTLKFIFDKNLEKNFEAKSEINFEIKEIIIHPQNQNQLCFYGEEYIGFISDLKSISNNSDTNQKNSNLFSQMKSNPNQYIIKIIHTSLLEKDFTSKNPEHKFIKFKFSEFDNHFGVLLKDSTFRFYSINSSITLNLITFNSSYSAPIVDFAFSPFTEFGWENFSVFFLDRNGGISYVCPFMPEIFEIKESFLTQMTKFHKHLRIIEDSHENILNENLLYHLENSVIDYVDETSENNSFRNTKFPLKKNMNIKNKKVKIKIDEYLKNLNQRHNLENLVTIDKRRSADIMLLSEGEKISYNQLHVLSSSPLTFLRISETNTIDCIVCNENITPIRKNKDNSKAKNYFSDTISEKEISCFLVETIQFKLFDKSISCGIKFLHRGLEENINTLCYVNILSNLYKLEFPYLNRLSYYLKYFNGKDDLNIGEFKSEVSEILNFDYNFSVKQKIPYGFLCLEKINKKFLIISAINQSLLVNEIDDIENIQDEIGSSYIDKTEASQTQNLYEFLQNIQNKINKYNFFSGKSDSEISNLEQILQSK
jgi:hypothetical protein